MGWHFALCQVKTTVTTIGRRLPLNLLAGEVAAIARGTTVERDSALVPGHMFLYSDWSVRVNAVFKNRSQFPIQSGDTITVVQSGGELLV